MFVEDTIKNNEHALLTEAMEFMDGIVTEAQHIFCNLKLFKLLVEWQLHSQFNQDILFYNLNMVGIERCRSKVLSHYTNILCCNKTNWKGYF